MSKSVAPQNEPITKTFGTELSAQEIQQVAGADWWPDITIEDIPGDNSTLKLTFSAVEVTVEW